MNIMNTCTGDRGPTLDTVGGDGTRGFIDLYSTQANVVIQLLH